MSEEEALRITECEEPDAMATDGFHNETKYVVLSYMGLVPPSLELESDSSENEDRDDSSGHDDEEEDVMRSTSSPDSQLQVVGRLELEESDIACDSSTVDDCEEEGQLVTEAEELAKEQAERQISESSSQGQSQGTPKFVIEEYVEPSDNSNHDNREVSGKQSQLTRLVMPLREELSQQLDALDEERGCPSPRVWTASPRILSPPSPEAIVASRIAAIGDQIMQEHQHQRELNSAVRKLLGLPPANVTYDVFKEAAKDVIESDTTSSGWHQVASVLNFSRHVAFGLVKKGERGIGRLTEYSVKLIEENMANFIIQQGGWEAVYRMTQDDAELYSTPSDQSIPNSPWSDGLYLTLPPRKSSGSEVSDPSTGPPSPSWKELGQPFLIPGKPHRVTPSNLLRGTPSNFERCGPGQSVPRGVLPERCDFDGGMQSLDVDTLLETESGYSSNVDTIPPSVVDDQKTFVCQPSEKPDGGPTQCVSTQTSGEEIPSPELEFDNSDVVAAMLGISIAGDNDTESGGVGEPDAGVEGQGSEVVTQEMSTQTEAAPWFSVSSAAALALGVSVGIAAMKNS